MSVIIVTPRLLVVWLSVSDVDETRVEYKSVVGEVKEAEVLLPMSDSIPLLLDWVAWSLKLERGDDVAAAAEVGVDEV